jgi:ribonuclease T2
MTRLIRGFLIGAVFIVSGVARANAQTRPGTSFDYYLLTLSWAPDFCASGSGYKDPNECGAGRHVGFIVHGLWPQNNQGRGPGNCGGVNRVPSAVVNSTLSMIPSESLIQHEWRAHGTCSGLSAQDYFAALRQARASISVPAAFTSMTTTTTESESDIAKQFADANPTLIPASIRVACKGGALQEVRVCLDKNLRSRGCTNSAGSCNASRIRILPTR